jgi:hypothetical protein
MRCPEKKDSRAVMLLVNRKMIALDSHFQNATLLIAQGITITSAWIRGGVNFPVLHAVNCTRYKPEESVDTLI